MRHEMVAAILKRARRRRNPQKGLVFHSDRGIQHACEDFRKELADDGFSQSMSRKKDCRDNAVAESFFAIIKTGLVNHEKYRGRQDTLHSLFEHIEAFCNRERKHSAIRYLFKRPGRRPHQRHLKCGRDELCHALQTGGCLFAPFLTQKSGHSRLAVFWAVLLCFQSIMAAALEPALCFEFIISGYPSG